MPLPCSLHPLHPLIYLCITILFFTLPCTSSSSSPFPSSSSSLPAVVVPTISAVKLAAKLSIHKKLLRDGYVRIPSLLSHDDALAWEKVVVAAAQKRAESCTLIPKSPSLACEPTPPQGAPTSFFRARDLAATDAGLAALTHSRALARLVASALRLKGLRFYSASVFIKHTGDERSRWHADAAAMPFRTDKIVTLWLSLADIDADAGALKFLNGSHLPGVPRPSLRDVPVFERPFAMATWADATDDTVHSATGLNITRAHTMVAGDATLHLGWTLHSASPNRSKRDRVALAITYFVDNAQIENILEMLPSGKGDARGGVRFSGDGGGDDLIVHLLADDVDTWSHWLHERVLIPGAQMNHEMLTPLLYGGGGGGGDL